MTYPGFQFDRSIFEEKSRQDTLRWLKVSLEELFPRAEVQTNAELKNVVVEGSNSTRAYQDPTLFSSLFPLLPY